ncbi:hypothetical protein M5689_021085 [Euphorbia peplus]|nr:hypothetical protein M5689_021085 [Euphorbia peplus]
MKFLLELVLCCRSDVVSESNSDTNALMLTASKRRRCKRKKRGPNSSSSDWKPSLSAITEDKPVVVLEERIVKRRSHVHSPPPRSLEDRRDHFTAIPTFSATPFMF